MAHPAASSTARHPAAQADGTVVIALYRDQQGKRGRHLGDVVYTPGKGWKFLPDVRGKKPSKKFHATWENALPRWTGGLDATMSNYVRTYKGERYDMPDLRHPAPSL